MKRYILRIIADFPADDDMWVGDVTEIMLSTILTVIIEKIFYFI